MCSQITQIDLSNDSFVNWTDLIGTFLKLQLTESGAYWLQVNYIIICKGVDLILALVMT